MARFCDTKDALLSGAKSLDRIADEIGYESASAFSTAFTKARLLPGPVRQRVCLY